MILFSRKHLNKLKYKIQINFQKIWQTTDVGRKKPREHKTLKSVKNPQKFMYLKHSLAYKQFIFNI